MIVAIFQELRPKQWTKNLLLFAGVLFSRQFGSWELVVRAAAGFLSFSLLAGVVYIVNDVFDASADRLHPRKKNRPIASGRLPIPVAWASLVPLLAISGALAWWLGLDFSIIAVCYLALNVVYSFGLKHQVLIDVFVVAIGFVMRAIAGVALLLPVQPGIEISPWLLVCTFFGALFLGLAKRRREITNAGADAAARRSVLDHYTPELLDGLLLVSAASSIIGYALYTIWPATVAKFHTEALLYTVPFVAYGIFRYLYLVGTSENTEDPSSVLLSDRPLGACVVLYVLAVGIILYHH